MQRARGRPANRNGRHRAIAAAPVVLAGIAAGLFAAFVAPAGATNDPYFPEQWALQRINAPAAWTKSTGSGIRIGIVDTGIDLQHEDLAAKVVAATSCIGANGISTACTGSAQDDQGHGTHVSGIAAAVTGNAKGVAGVAPDSQLVVVKALGASGSGALNDVNAGIEWAVLHGARVVNLSLESDSSQVTTVPGESLRDGVEFAWSHGAIPVIAAGNATPSLFGATGYQGIDAVIVGATGRADEVAWYSSSLATAKWGLVAPGGDVRDSEGRPSCAGALAAGCIVSTGWFAAHPDQHNAYADDEGTSMAAPHVAGVLALLLAQGLSPTDAVTHVLSSADKIACGDGCHGRLDAAAAVGAPVPPPTTTTPTSATTVPATPPTSRPAAPPAVTGGTATPVSAPPPTAAATTVPATGSAAATGAPSHPPPSSHPQAIRPVPVGHHHLPGILLAVAALLLAAVAGEAVLVRRAVGAGEP